MDNVPCAAYAMYNGGPGRGARYRTPGTRVALRSIDEVFWAKFRAVREGCEVDGAKCLEQVLCGC